MAWKQEGILGANIRFANKKGELAFEMKKKEGYGKTYYIFRIYIEHFTEEQKKKWPEVWALMRNWAAKLGLPLYDYQEICDATGAYLNLIAKTPEINKAQEKSDEMDEVTFVKDIKIKVFDHATGNLNDLTIGISTTPVDIVA